MFREGFQTVCYSSRKPLLITHTLNYDVFLHHTNDETRPPIINI